MNEKHNKKLHIQAVYMKTFLVTSVPFSQAAIVRLIIMILNEIMQSGIYYLSNNTRQFCDYARFANERAKRVS